MQLRKKVSGLVAGLLSASGVMAAPPDFTSLTAAVDFSTAGAAVLLVAAGLAGVYIISGGASMIIEKIKKRG